MEKTKRDIGCPAEELLGSYLDGALDGAGVERVEDHLSRCGGCRRQSLGTDEALAARRPPVRGWMRGRRRSIPIAAAASILALAGTAWVGGVFRSRSSNVDPIRAAAERMGGDPASVETASGERRAILLPDGTLLEAVGRTRFRFLAKDRVERCRLALDEGELRADVADAPGAFRIAHANGEIRVLGTRFSALAFHLDGTALGGTPRTPCLRVDVHEGAVALIGERGEAPVRAGERGLLIPGLAPVRQEQAGTPAALIEEFARTLRAAGQDRFEVPPERREGAWVLAATFWGAFNETFAGGIPPDPGVADPRDRAARALLVRMGFPEITGGNR